MKELRFHRELYDGNSVDAAVKVFDRVATFELIEEQAHWLVKVTATGEHAERDILGELANAALALTIEGRA